MRYEVERKYRIADLPALLARLAELGAKPGDAEAQEDCYYAHPSRDFAATDEALRLRRAGDKNRITYKGPKVGSQSKTRRELELDLPAGDRTLADFAKLLEALGFRSVATVRKRRRQAALVWHGQDVEVSLDEVERVGSFVELELGSDDAGLPRAERSLASLAEKLQLGVGERRSYLELLLEAQGPGSS
ncbi:MAG TPA: class IV adenylate cyclase [Pirellulales bacterium]|jgi:adenylate cyclase class 2|nr:class IV adenylate cyclase [Pirellulales bacterium]